MKQVLITIALVASLFTLAGAEKKIVFVAGPASHGPGEHEHRAGCLLLKDCLDTLPGITSIVCSNGWPQDAAATFAGADTIVFFSDGGFGHPLLQQDRLAMFRNVMSNGVGLVTIHYACEPTLDAGIPEFLDWLGGCFEVNWSVNPIWTADFKSFPDHPVARGVDPFLLRDEWYFHMRFREGMQGVTPILSAIAPESTMARADGLHSGNPHVREAVKRGEPQHVAWAAERPSGGRGFGITGAHYHSSWANDDFRKTVLNSILWTAKAAVPADGVKSKVTPKQMQANLDDKAPKKK